MAEETSQKENPTDHTNSETAESSDLKNTEQVNDLQQKLDSAQKLAYTFKDQLLRKAAEFENFKKRSEADYANIVKSANEGLITSLIPILDDFARSLKSGQETREYESFFKGVEMIHNKFSKLLESRGLVPFDSVGKPFDVEYHDALLQMPRSDVPPHMVVEEIQRGYRLFEKVIRHAKVIVSAEPEQSPSNSETQGADTN